MPRVPTAVACDAAQQRLRRDHRGVGPASAATTSIDEISGAAARTASSTASSRVTDDDGQLLQLPANCSRTHLAVDLEQLDVAAVRAEIGPHAVQRILDPALDVVRMQAVHQQQAGDQVVGDERVGQLGVGGDRDAPSSAPARRRRGRSPHGPIAPRVRARRRHPPRWRRAASVSDRPPCAIARLFRGSSRAMRHMSIPR